jgi:hypothetical protein
MMWHEDKDSQNETMEDRIQMHVFTYLLHRSETRRLDTHLHAPALGRAEERQPEETHPFHPATHMRDTYTR